MARLSFAYLFFGEAKKSKARGRRTPCGKKKKPAASQRQKAIGRAEQRSGDRIRVGACLSEASLRTTPDDASSARHPEGARPLARLSFAYLFFGEAKKSKARGRRTPCGKKKKPAASQTQRTLLARLFFGYFL